MTVIKFLKNSSETGSNGRSYNEIIHHNQTQTKMKNFTRNKHKLK